MRSRTARLVVLVVVLATAMGLLLAYLRIRPEPPAPLEGAHGRPPVAPEPDSGIADGAAEKPARERPRRPDDALAATLAEQREQLFSRMQRELELSSSTLATLRALFEQSPVLSQGNPKVTVHPMKRSECWAARDKAGLHSPEALAKLAENEARCGARHMTPIGKDEAGATVCIDQYEFPNIPCEYPVVFASAKQSSDLCQALGKRLCDAHEWEGACAGELLPAKDEYLWDRPRRIEMEFFKNQKRPVVWAYGPKKDHAKCATGSEKSPKCGGGGWDTCGSNTYPAGAFPLCVSRFGVYDQHGNAAEHMNLPMKPEELSSRGGLGQTEMKGSWFIFLRGEAHEDDCRWRAPDWHGGRVASPNSHLNYHLGFRCCKTAK